MTCPSWVSLHGIAHSFSELLKPLHHNKVAIHEGDEFQIEVIIMRFPTCFLIQIAPLIERHGDKLQLLAMLLTMLLQLLAMLLNISQIKVSPPERSFPSVSLAWCMRVVLKWSTFIGRQKSADFHDFFHVDNFLQICLTVYSGSSTASSIPRLYAATNGSTTLLVTWWLFYTCYSSVLVVRMPAETSGNFSVFLGFQSRRRFQGLDTWRNAYSHQVLPGSHGRARR